MPNKKLLIVSSSRNEAITKWIFRSEFATSVDLVFIDELLNKYEIRDELDLQTTTIQWYESENLKISNETHCVLNRIIYIEDAIFKSFQLSDRAYAKREFEAYLGFALNSFAGVQNIAVNGICERVYSLPQQWQLVNTIIKENVPQYYWGSKIFNSLEMGSPVVHTNIFDFLNWSPSLPSRVSEVSPEVGSGSLYKRARVIASSLNSTDKHSKVGLIKCDQTMTKSSNIKKYSDFCFKRPEGNPLFILSIGSCDLLTKDYKLSDLQLEKIKILLNKVRVLFGYFIFELLLFIAEEEITFGCINIDVIRSQKNPQFDDFLHKNLIEEYSKCLN